MTAAICKLCQEPRTLRLSHIIPERLYLPIYDSKHRTLAFSPGESTPDLLQQGLRERLLCRACENFLNDEYENASLGPWEEIAGLRPPRKLTVERFREGAREAVGYSGLDYATFKLFLLSILWRAGVSTLEAFADVSLGEKHEARLRRMIRERHPGDRDDYCVTLTKIREGRDVAFIQAPNRQPLQDGRRAYRFPLPGLSVIFSVSSHPPFPELRTATVQPNGRVLVPVLSLREFGNLQAMAQTFRDAKIPPKW